MLLINIYLLVKNSPKSHNIWRKPFIKWYSKLINNTDNKKRAIKLWIIKKEEFASKDIHQILNFKKYKLKKNIVVNKTPEILCQIENKDDTCGK